MNYINMNYIKVILTLVINVFCYVSYAQNPVTMSKSQLVGTKWKLVEPASNRVKSTISFGESETVSEIYLIRSKRSASTSYLYYLSNTPSQTFDDNNLKNTAGAYIIEKNNINGQVTTTDVMYFSIKEEIMILKSRPAEGVVGRTSLLRYELIR